MPHDTALLIESIMERVDSVAININWKSEGSALMLGERKSQFRGHGTEFFELDYYQPGDDVRDIDWAATARIGRKKPLKIVRQEERQISVHVLVNIDLSMQFGTMRCTKKDLAAEMAATVFYCANETRDRAGLIAYSGNGVEAEVTPSTVARTLYPSLSGVLDTEVKPRVRGQTDFGLGRALGLVPLDRSLIVVVSDFINMAEPDWNQLEEAALVHDVLCVYVQDLRERELPGVGLFGCVYELQDYEGSSTLIWNNYFSRRAHAKRFRQHETFVKSELARRNCELITVSTEENEEDVMARLLTLFSNHE